MGMQDRDAVVMGWMALECERRCEKGRKLGQRSVIDMLPIPLSPFFSNKNCLTHLERIYSCICGWSASDLANSDVLV